MIKILTTDNINEVMSNYPAGTNYVLEDGVHYLNSDMLKLKPGDTIKSESGDPNLCKITFAYSEPAELK